MTTPESRLSADAGPTRPATGADEWMIDATSLIHAAEAEALPTSFGVFDPVGHVMLGLPTQALTDALVSALHNAGWPASSVRQFSPLDSVAVLQEMVDNAGPLAGFGYQITLLRRYLDLALQGTQWLLIQAEDGDRAAQAADIARSCGATMAVHYRTLTVEELIP